MEKNNLKIYLTYLFKGNYTKIYTRLTCVDVRNNNKLIYNQFVHLECELFRNIHSRYRRTT